MEHDSSGGDNVNSHEQPYAHRNLSEIVRNNHVEPGIPRDLTAGTNKNMRKVAFLGVGIVAAGAAVAGLIAFSSGNTEQTAESQPAQKEADVAGNTRPKDFNQDKEKIMAAAREAEAAEAASAPAPASPASGTPAAEQTTLPSGADSQPSDAAVGGHPGEKPADPVESIHDRRLKGEMFVETDSTHLSGDKQSDKGGDAGSTVSPPSGGLLGESDSEKSSGSGSSFADKLNPSFTPSTNAEQRGDLTYLLAKGTNLRCGLETRIVTTQPGFTRCVVSQDVYSANGKVLLVERGSKVTGEQTSALLHGQAMVFVLWNELETPSGVKVSLRSPGSGALGESGHRARVRYHFWQRFGGAIMISLIKDVGTGFSNSQVEGGGSNNNISYENSSDAAQDMATEVLKNSINIPPTGEINQGSLINIMVARDVNFDQVYETVPNPMMY
ncbi:hypothetical protein AKG09_01930 [Neisseria sp. 83E34]|nr:hypothetical protein AKG09_01930 [Neisseria sp. 83E34]